MICPLCKHQHDSEGDQYGCPNCLGEGMGEPKSKADMMRRLREQRRQAGLVKVECYIKPEHRERLAKYVKRLK